MSMKRMLLLASIMMACGSPAAFAHHSFAMFDREQKVTVSGTVKVFDWRNPHVFITLEVPNDETDEADEWLIEAGSRNMLTRMGWNRVSLESGDDVEMVVFPRADGEPGGSLVEASVDGTKIGN